MYLEMQSNEFSHKLGPINWSPKGNPDSDNLIGNETAGIP